MSNTNRSQSCGLSYRHMSKPLMYEPLSLCFNAFKWSCESSRTGPISEPAVKAQSHLLPWWTERVHRKWNWKSIRHTHMYTHIVTHTEGHISHFKALIIIITDVWWAAAWCRMLIQAKKHRFTGVIELQSKNYESERAPECTQCKRYSNLEFN